MPAYICTIVLHMSLSEDKVTCFKEMHRSYFDCYHVKPTYVLNIGTAHMDPKSNGRVSATCLGYIMITNCLGPAIGASVCLILKPGVGVAVDKVTTQGDIMETGDIFADLLR